MLVADLKRDYDGRSPAVVRATARANLLDDLLGQPPCTVRRATEADWATVRPHRSTDADLRAAVHRALAAGPLAVADAPTIDEMAVCRGRARVDIAAIGNTTLHAFELKSDVDRLTRLAGQLSLYGQVFDEITVVVSPRHVAAVKRAVPGWCGIWLFHGQASLPSTLRPARPNPGRDPRAVVGLLWREEMLELLEDEVAKSKLARAPRRDLIRALLESYTFPDLDSRVKFQLQERLRAGAVTEREAAPTPA